MKITHEANAGSLESNDLMVIVKPVKDNAGIIMDISSIVTNQYGDRIKEIVQEELKDRNIDSIHITIRDRGALDCTIKARIETAIKRSVEGWS